MAEQYQVRKLTGAGILGTYTKKQIDELWDKGKLGGTDSVLYQGEWILLSEFENRIKQVAEQEINKLAEEKAAEEDRVRSEREKEKHKRREEEQKEEADHRREIERIQAEAASKADPGMRGNRHIPGGAQTPEPPPPFPDSDAAKPPKEKKIPAGTASGGGGIFCVIILAVLWYQGYWDPSDLKALTGQSKYIPVVRDYKVQDSTTIGDVYTQRITSLEWKSKRASKRTEIIIYCEGDIDLRGRSGKVHTSWVVNKAVENHKLDKVTINNTPLDNEQQDGFLNWLLTDL